MAYQTLTLDVTDHIAHISLCRPKEFNSMILEFWQEMVDVFAEIADRPDARVVVISSEGKHFTSGLDLNAFSGIMSDMTDGDPGRKREQLFRTVKEMQQTFTVIEKCRLPVLAAIQGGCIGGGVDLATACDIRYCTANAFVVIQEINIGMVADVGTLQRLPKLISLGKVKELAYTGRRMYADESKECGLMTEVFKTQEEMLEAVMETAKVIASKSPLSVVGSKEVINYSRDHSVDESLNQIALWNAGMLMSTDIMEAAKANAMKTDPEFADILPLKKIVK
ncbi:MAG: crotonase/enoyl-CoA hydratase family protein [Rhodospirillales bacterium]|nr:crotonase/enoyl-CoA hydratase family protein [Rhodospirillales bacterium]